MSYQVLKGLHIVAVIAWMAGLLYMPRLFVYHTDAQVGSELDSTFQVMEAKLERIIMTPAMLMVAALGTVLLALSGWGWLERPWLQLKLAGVGSLIAWHVFLMQNRRRLARGERRRTARFWRMTNELPFLAVIVIVLCVTTKF